eukprot:COSAG03_NODE_586_length_6845_cov_6.664101_5_plen_168_part_00
MLRPHFESDVVVHSAALVEAQNTRRNLHRQLCRGVCEAPRSIFQCHPRGLQFLRFVYRRRKLQPWARREWCKAAGQRGSTSWGHRGLAQCRCGSIRRTQLLRVSFRLRLLPGGKLWISAPNESIARPSFPLSDIIVPTIARDRLPIGALKFASSGPRIATAVGCSCS